MRKLGHYENKCFDSILFVLFSASTQELDTGDQFGRTPLMFCVLADRLECAELLLRAGTQVNKCDKGGRTALHWAAHKVIRGTREKIRQIVKIQMVSRHLSSS